MPPVPDLVQPRYGLVNPGNVDPDATRGTTNAAQEVMAKWRLGWGPQTWARIAAGQHDPDPGFNPWDGIEGYEQYASDLIFARSKAEQDDIKRLIDRNLVDQQRAAAGNLGLFADLLAGVADPANLVPVPAVKGIGIVRGAARLAATFTGIAGVTETLRQSADPTAQPGEMVANIGLAALLGGLVGAPVGAWGARRRAAIMDLEKSIASVDNPNVTLRPRGVDENVRLEFGRPPPDAQGVRPLFATLDQLGDYTMKTASDGNNYTYVEGLGWHHADDVGRETPRVVGQDIVDELGIPERAPERVMYVDDVRVKHQYTTTKWQDELQPLLKEGENIETVVRNADDYLNYRMTENLWKQRLPQKVDESADDWAKRVGEQAMEEFRASRAGGQYANARGMEWLLERLNRSPLTKAIRVFNGDNVVADTALRIAGDYGWAIKANEFGFRTPPSILMKAMRHTARWVEFRAEFDKEWLRYVSQNQGAEGVVKQSFNMSASMYAVRQAGRKLAGQNVLTYEDFSQMVGRAVYTKGHFEVNGHAVNQNARNAAKAYTRMMQEYDRKFRALGLYGVQKGTKRLLQSARKAEARHADKVARWLWGATGEPSALIPAIKVGDRVFSGASHDEAIQNMLDALGPAGDKALDDIKPDQLGYVSRETKGPDPIVDPPGEPQIDTTELDEAMRGLPATDELLDPAAPTAKSPYQQPEKFARRKGKSVPSAKGGTITDEIDKFGLSRIESDDPFAFDPDVANFKTAGEVLDHFRTFVDDPDYLELIDLIADDVKDTKFRVVDRGEWDAAADSNALDYQTGALATAIGRFVPRTNEIIVRGDWGQMASGTNPEVVLHEALHGVTSRRIAQGQLDRRQGKTTPYTQALDELEAIDADLRALVERDRTELNKGMNVSERQALDLDLQAMTGDLHEVMTYAITHKPIRDYLKTQPAGAPRGWIKTKWDELLASIAKLLGWDSLTPKQVSQLDRLMSLTDDFVDLDQPLLAGEKAPGKSMEARGEESFVSQEKLIEQREASLTPAQQKIYVERKKAWDEAKLFAESTQAQLDQLNSETHHTFVDKDDAPEPYYNRYFDKSAIAAEREKFTRLIEKWYARDEATGARARAEETVDKILAGDEGSAHALSGGMRSLNQRALNVPNSWVISDGELGDIAMADFIDNNILATSETYIRRGGARLEAAEAFGDSDLRMEMANVREHLLSQYYDVLDESDEAGREAVIAKINETLGWLDLTAKSTLGTIRTTDPWRWDNRAVRMAMDLTSLSVMGKILFTAVPEILRAPMTQGFGTAFRTVFMRYLDDLETIRPNLEFLQLSGEVKDMALTRANVRAAEMNAGETTTGGTWLEREIAARVPGFFKITGLTSWTVWAKEWVMLSAQHSVMADARRIGEAIASGRRPSSADALRLSALGINARDAILLSQMPVDIKPGGKLIMPAIDNWPQTGDGRRAREALLTAIHAEARRAIVTPSIGDKSTVFNGVWSRDGKAVKETDIMRLPMQFFGYGMAAHNKVLTSALQGRDKQAVMGIFFMMLGGIMSNYLKLNENAWRNKSYDEIMLDGWEAAGIGGFWFNDLNGQIERFTQNNPLVPALGIRPTLGMDPKFGDPKMDAMIDIAGSAPSHFFDVSRAFWDSSLSANERAQLIRRGVPYNNVIWWGGITRNLAGEIGGFWEGSAK